MVELQIRSGALAVNAQDLAACAADGAAPQLVARVGLEKKLKSLQDVGKGQTGFEQKSS